MAQIPDLTLANGFKMPAIGLGTLLSKAGEVRQAVMDAIDVGYRHIDTAFFYQNEKEIGEAIQEKIKDGTVKREDLFITTKLWNNRHKAASVVPMCKKSLENLGLTYVDLYLIHWPFAFVEGDELIPQNEKGDYLTTDTDYVETWKGMEECVRQGLTRSIGVSNFNSEQITRVLEAAKIVPVNNQVEIHMLLNQKPLIDFCLKRNITVTGYSPLGRPGYKGNPNTFLTNPKLEALAKKYKKSPAQIALKSVLQQGVAIIPKTVTSSRLKENVDILDFSLTPEEMAELAKLSTGDRISPYKYVQDHKYYPFAIPF